MNAHATPTAARRAALPILRIAAVLLVLAAIVWLRRHEPSYSDKIAPILVEGRVGQRLEARNFAVEVKRAKLARAYLTRPGVFDDAPRETRGDGIWMSVLVEAEPLQDAGFIGAQLRTRDGLLYRASAHDRPNIAGNNFTGQQLLAGVRGTGAYFFDLPPDRVAGAHVQFYWGTIAPANMDHLVDVDLGIDDAAARKLLADAPARLDLR